MQCHLESTSSPLPFQIRRYEHPPFSYTPEMHDVLGRLVRAGHEEGDADQRGEVLPVGGVEDLLVGGGGHEAVDLHTPSTPRHPGMLQQARKRCRSARVDALERGPGEEEALLADVAEADDGLGLVALAVDVDDHALAELLVGDVVADVQPELLGAAAPGRPAPARRRRRDAIAAATTASRCAPKPRPRPRRRSRLALRLDELLGDLGEEPARRVVVGRRRTAAAPRVAEVQPLARPG